MTARIPSSLLVMSALLSVAFLALPSPFVSAQASEIGAAEVDAVIRAEFEATWGPGCALAVVKGGKLMHSSGYGLADIEHQAAMSPSTVFPISSVTKQFTAVLILMLADEGKLTLDEPLSKWVDGIPDEWKPVTLRQLLSHQSGITAYTASVDFRKAACRAFEPGEIIAFAASKPMRFPPGQQSGYSNTNHFLLGLVIEKVSGKPFCDVVAERIAKPLGMASTGCVDPSAILPGRAAGYTGRSRELARHAEPVSPSSSSGSGALASTIEDMVKWDAALQGGKLLRPERVRQLATMVTLADGSPTPYGLGWVLEQHGGHRALVQSGALPGFSAAILRLPDDDLFVVAMTNSDMVSAGHLAVQVATLWAPAMRASMSPIADPDPKLTARIREFMLALPAGTISRDEFTPDAAAKLLPAPLAEAGRFLSGLGSLQALELLDRRPMDGGLIACRYKVTYERLTLVATWTFTADGKVTGMELSPT